ncbi:LysR family transcriptional regulator [Streptomyces armeniacus]|uniref:LysR family transcriptional regulator n=1 Tax=Streptomyces armeniacus TaxID=83291 RepID=A0A345XNT6_9ACTN|nr:LysR family transcriptional regulator [Streptomyces armeniacus]AXK33302.1 LysR family transcriptional regulator [Streptomyces armeniacus]
MIDLRRLQTLRAVHQHGTVTAAAASLHLTPSAVSHHLRELARELRLTLIEPQGRRIRLTPAAHLVIEHGDAMLARWEEAEAALDAYRDGTAGLLRMCGFPTALSGLLAPAAVRLRDSRPDLTVELSTCETDTGYDMLASTETDLALIAPTDDAAPPDESRFDQRPILEEPLDLLVPPGHPLAGRDGVSLTDAADESWIVPRPGTCDHYQRVLANCNAAGFSLRISQYYAMEWSSISTLVSNGFGIALMPRLAETPEQHAAVRVPLTRGLVPTRRIVSCVRRGSREQPLIQRGLRAVAAVLDARPDLRLSSPSGA